MISIKEFKKLRKDEMIRIYEDLVVDYEDLEQQYEEENEDNEDNSLGLLLQELKFNTDLQEKIQEQLFKAYKQDFIETLRFYCVDIPEEIYNIQRPTISGINEKICDIFEDYIEEALRFKIWE